MYFYVPVAEIVVPVPLRRDDAMVDPNVGPKIEVGRKVDMILAYGVPPWEQIRAWRKGYVWVGHGRICCVRDQARVGRRVRKFRRLGLVPWRVREPYATYISVLFEEHDVPILVDLRSDI